MSAIEQSSGFPMLRQRLLALLQGCRNSRLLRNILTVVSGTAGAQALTLAFMPVITRIYGPEAYGVLGTFLSVTLMLIPVAALTYPIAIVLPRRDGDARGLVRLSLRVALAMALLVAALLLLVGETLTTRLQMQIIQPYLLLVPLVMFFGAALEICQQWLFRTQRFQRRGRSLAAVQFDSHAGRVGAAHGAGAGLQHRAAACVARGNVGAGDAAGQTLRR